MGVTIMSRVYLVHGWAYNLDKYQELIKLLNHRGIEVEVLNVPGLTQPSSKVWNIEEYADWLNDKLKKDQNPIVIGHSNGGRITLKYINMHPGHISKLVLIDSAGVFDDSKTKSLKLSIYKSLAKLGKPLKSIPYVRQVFYKLIGATDYYKAKPNMKKTMQNMLSADKNIDLNNIKTPTEIIWGREDKLTPLSDAYKLKKAIPGSVLTVIDDARHSPHANHPQEVANVIYDFIKKT